MPSAQWGKGWDTLTWLTLPRAISAMSSEQGAIPELLAAEIMTRAEVAVLNPSPPAGLAHGASQGSDVFPAVTFKSAH